MFFDQKLIIDILDQMQNLEIKYKSRSNHDYLVEGKRVPRVTEVLSAMLHEDSLMSWANGLGWKRISYRAFMREAADKGTYSHLAIEKFLKEKNFNLNDFAVPNEKIFNAVCSALDGFTKWWNELHNLYKDIEIIFIEETMIHKYFGGTCDCLLRVDGEYLLIDFKTSNHMSYNYALQIAAYRYLLKELKGIDISKATVLVLSKENHNYTSYDLDFSISEHIKFISECEETFLLLVAAYNSRLASNSEYNKIYNIEY